VENPAGPGRLLAKNPDLIHWLAAAVAMALDGVAVNAIARWLTDSGAPVPGRRTGRGEGTASWTRQTVDGLLRNPILAGMRPHNPGRGRKGTPVDPFNVVRDQTGEPVIDESLAVISFELFAGLQHLLATRTVPQARKRGERRSTSQLPSRLARCDHCDVFLCRGTNQGKPVLTRPRCRQAIGRAGLDPYLARRLLAERGDEAWGASTVGRRWQAADGDDLARREILMAQLETLRVRRGVVGRRFDEGRVVISWRPSQEGWGAGVVGRLSRDLRRDLPGQRGWSRADLLYMRRAAEVWPSENEFVQHVAGQLPWGHIMVLLDRLPTREERDWYAVFGVCNCLA
jgi:hypothetical protein